MPDALSLREAREREREAMHGLTDIWFDGPEASQDHYIAMARDKEIALVAAVLREIARRDIHPNRDGTWYNAEGYTVTVDPSSVLDAIGEDG